MLIQEYQTQWNNDFQVIRSILDQALVGLNVSIEHVGSTAVPDLAAKPIIDIDIAFADNVRFAEIRSRLEHIGYFHNSNQGIRDREVFKRDNAPKAHPVLDSLAHHLYVCPVHSQELWRHLLFRDYLRKHTDARQEYQALKYRIAEEARQDRKNYAALKEIHAKAFVEMILTKAWEENNNAEISLCTPHSVNF